jgi:hypothetical protein
MGVIGGRVFCQTRTVRMTEVAAPEARRSAVASYSNIRDRIRSRMAGRIEATNSPEAVKQFGRFPV